VFIKILGYSRVFGIVYLWLRLRELLIKDGIKFGENLYKENNSISEEIH
jgi:hypothetical protein